MSDRRPGTTKRSKRPTEAERARHWQKEIASREQDGGRRAFEARLKCQPGKGQILLGRTLGAPEGSSWIGLSAADLLGCHMAVTGATGSGKSFSILSLLWQVLHSALAPVILVDLKGELASLLLDILLPSLWEVPECEQLLRNVRVIRPFDRDRVPLLRLTEPEPGVSREVQAMNLASSLEDALGYDLGARMRRVFLRLVGTAIDLGEPLPILTRWLSNPAALMRDSQKSTDPVLREYAREGLAQENASSLEALTSRLDLFLFLPETRLALSTGRCFSLPESLESGLTIIDVGNPPAGAERVARFWGGVLIGRLSRAIMGREVREGSPQTVVILEEFQEALSANTVEQFGRLLALSRFKKVALWFVNQQPGQLSAVDPALPKLLRTNTAVEMVFRSSFEDAKTLGPALMGAQLEKGKLTRGRGFEDLTRLPDREFFLWLKKEAFGAHRVRSPRVDLERMKQLAARAPEEFRRNLLHGSVTISRAELEDSLAVRKGPAARKVEVPRLKPASVPANPSSFPDLG